MGFKDTRSSLQSEIIKGYLLYILGEIDFEKGRENEIFVCVWPFYCCPIWCVEGTRKGKQIYLGIVIDNLILWVLVWLEEFFMRFLMDSWHSNCWNCSGIHDCEQFTIFLTILRNLGQRESTVILFLRNSIEFKMTHG